MLDKSLRKGEGEPPWWPPILRSCIPNVRSQRVVYIAKPLSFPYPSLRLPKASRCMTRWTYLISITKHIKAESCPAHPNSS